MKRIILFFALIVSICFLSSCNNDQDGCGAGGYWNAQTQQCVPYPNGSNNGNNNNTGLSPWLNWQWINYTGYIWLNKPIQQGWDPDGNVWYAVEACTQAGKKTIWIKGDYDANQIGEYAGSSCTVKITFTTNQILPVIKTAFYGGTMISNGTQTAFICSGYSPMYNWTHTPCDPY